VAQPSTIWTEVTSTSGQSDSTKEIRAIEVGQEVTPAGILVFKHLPPAYLLLGVDFDGSPAVHFVEVSAFAIVDAQLPRSWILNVYSNSPYWLTLSPNRWGNAVDFLKRVASRDVDAVAVLREGD
jgi:hypothetical protein